MRKLLRAALPFALLLSGTASAVEIEAGGRTIEIPIPSGYSEMTPEMSPYYDAMFAYVVPTNERYLAIVPADAAEAHLRGKDAEYYRYMLVEAEIQSVRLDITQAQFDELRDTMRSQLEEVFESKQDLHHETVNDPEVLKEMLPDLKKEVFFTHASKVVAFQQG